MTVGIPKVYEYKEIVAIHLISFKDFFLTSLGRDFLNFYYKACLMSNECISVCYYDDKGIIQGFCIGSIKSKGFHKRLVLKNLFSFIYIGFILFIKDYNSIIRIFKNLEKKTDDNDDGNYSEILSIGVSPVFKHQGIGKSLINKFEEIAKKKRCIKVSLTTDFYNNDNVIAFYKNNGYYILKEFITYPNRKMYKLIKEL